MSKGTGPNRDRSLSTPRPWVAVQDPIDTTWRILHRLPDNNIIVAIVADEGNAKLICEVVNSEPSIDTLRFRAMWEPPKSE